MSRVEVWNLRPMAGKRSTALLEGIGVFTAQRLDEEGIDAIQHLALCDAADLARRTRYSEATVADWKDQAILYLLAGDCVVPGTPPNDKSQPVTLYDLLDLRAGIRTMSALMRRVVVPQGGGGPSFEGGALKYLQLRSRFAWSRANLVALLRINLFTHRELWAWLDQPFEGPPTVLIATQGALDLG